MDHTPLTYRIHMGPIIILNYLGITYRLHNDYLQIKCRLSHDQHNISITNHLLTYMTWQPAITFRLHTDYILQVTIGHIHNISNIMTYNMYNIRPHTMHNWVYWLVAHIRAHVLVYHQLPPSALNQQHPPLSRMMLQESSLIPCSSITEWFPLSPKEQLTICPKQGWWEPHKGREASSCVRK
jgi:hypothetical protein